MRHRFRARRAMRMALLHVRLGRPARWRWALGPWTAWTGSARRPAHMVLGPWPGGRGRHRPARSMDQGWSAWPSPHGLSRGPRIWLVRRMDRGPSGWSAGPSLARSTVRQGGPRCRPSHGLSRGPHDRSGMWPIGPFAWCGPEARRACWWPTRIDVAHSAS